MDEGSGQGMGARRGAGDAGGDADSSGEAARRRRLDALRALAGQPGSAPTLMAPPTARASTRPPTLLAPRPPREPRPAWQIIGAGAVAIVVVVAVALVALRLMAQPSPPAPSRKAAPGPLVVPISRLGMQCVMDASWSPDGKHIAALMTPNACRKPSGGTVLVLYDAALAHPPQKINLDQAILPQVLPQSVLQDPTQMQQVSVGYNSLQWSADGARVAVLASGPLPTSGAGDGSSEQPFFWALALVDVRSGSVRVVPAPPQPISAFTGASSAYNTDSYSPVVAWRFDLITGTATLANFPQALAYTWAADGSLTPSVPLPAANGTPVTFSGAGAQWQAFEIGPSPLPCDAGMYELMLTGTAWSPDGRYVVPLLYMHGRLANGPVVAPTPTPLDGGGDSNPCATPNQPSDAANLAPVIVPVAIVTALSQMPAINNQVNVSGQFSPSGKLLAVQPLGTPYPPWVARVYDMATGKQRATIATTQLGDNVSLREAAVYGMAWSPDDAHLLLTSELALFLFGARALGG